MKMNVNFSKNFLSVCLGITIVLSSLSLLIFSIKPAKAEVSPKMGLNNSYQVGTAENYIPVGVYKDYAYWVIFNAETGYKFRKSPISGSHWISKTK